MSTLPNSGATELVASQANAELAVNAMGRRLDSGYSRAIIEDRDLSAAPGSCADGARYLVAATPGGGDAWAGQTGKLAIAVGTNAANGWLFVTVAVEGFRLYISDENTEIEWNGSWGTPSLSNGASASDIWAGTSTSKAATPGALQAAAVPTALTSSANITPDFNAGLNFTLTLQHDATLENPSNPQIGDSGIIEITQHASGGPHTLSYGTNWKFPGGAPILSTGAGEIDVLAYFVVASGRILANVTKGYTT